MLQGEIENGSLPVEMWVEKVIDNGALSARVITFVTINQMLIEKGVALPIKG